MKIIDLKETYYISEFFDFEACQIFEEDQENSYNIKQSTNFKKGYKKHKNDKNVMNALKEVLNELKEGTHPKNLPPKFNPHIIKRSEKDMWRGFWNVHLVGQKIIMLFKVDHDEKVIYLAHLGTHQEAKIQKT